MGLLITIVVFVFVVSLFSARIYWRRRQFARRQPGNMFIGSDSSTETTVVANSNVQVGDRVDQNRSFILEEAKDLSPFCK